MRYTYISSAILLILTFTVFLFDSSVIIAQNGKKTVTAVRTEVHPKIDGIIDEDIWNSAFKASDFVQYEPYNDRPASFQTEVRIMFDDAYIYIAAIMYDAAPDSILKELGRRDSGEQLNSDRFWVDINPFNDGINGFRFQVSASGIQTDINMSGSTGNGGDRNWDAVWKSAVEINEHGWVVEMEIPYSALRFPKQNVHEWGINFWREIRRTREVSSWNFVNRKIGNSIASLGTLTGIEDITPPVRLALYPYVSNYVEKKQHKQGWTNTFNGGMDLKWGINESFTMDMTLIPDFGQVQSDALVLNLSPYEVKYDEKRQFFTEGIELFRKADLFYSRRIGAMPKGHNNIYNIVSDNEVIIENPIETRLINATKISGRTSSGLGVGFFNAMTAPSHALLVDTITNIEREISTQPFTNYNLFVLDQSLKNNSYIGLINTNVIGSIDGYTANITGADFRIHDKSNLYRISGNTAISQQYYNDKDDNFGYKYALNIGKFGGSWQYNYYRSVISNSYQQNDMGFLSHNNTINNNASLSYNIFDPFWRFWNVSNAISVNSAYLYDPYTFAGMSAGYRLRLLFDTRFFVMLNLDYAPFSQKDFFEPRVKGRFYDIGQAFNYHTFISSDYRKRIYVDASINYYQIYSEHNQKYYTLDLKPTFRASNKLNLSYRFYYNLKNNNVGYVKHIDEETIYFGKRHSPTTVNSLMANYIFSKNLSLSFDLRHYWSTVNYTGEYFLLNNNGKLERIPENLEISDINYNAFTIDMMLIWYFAPGSQLSLMWKNAIYTNNNNIPNTFHENLSIMLKEPQINSVSLKILYYLDYSKLKSATRNTRQNS
ncbi:MAG: hypothetical protein KGZ97_10470 [Bacteroidetes bacterium]|nr:hypothetical protein [Bacteroidota bacterium]